MTQTCPNCKRFSPPEAQWCDCGYNFISGSLEGPKASVDVLAQRYDEAVAVARNYIKERWKHFQEPTKDWLISSKHYDKLGKVQALESGQQSDEIECLEYELGVLQRCARVKLPARGQSKGAIPGYVTNDDVLDIAASMLFGLRSHEPEFLRLGLVAVKQHQIANLLARLPFLPKDSELAPKKWTG